MNGWFFSSKPRIPYQRKFRVTLHGLQWYTNLSGTFDTVTNPTRNARLLEMFYEANQTWDNFAWQHPNLGLLQVRFSEPVSVPPGKDNSGGLIDPVEVMLVEYNPAY